MGVGGDVAKAVQGLRDLRTASLIMIVLQVLPLIVTIALFFLFLAVFSTSFITGGGMPMHGPPDLGSVMGALIPLLLLTVVVAIASVALFIYGVYFKLIPGASKLKEWRREFSTPSALIKVGYVAGLILVLAGVAVSIAALIAAFPSLPEVLQHPEVFQGPGGFMQAVGGRMAGLIAGIILIGIGGIMYLIGTVGVAILFFKLNDMFSESILLAAGITLLISVILGFVGFMLVLAAYVGIANFILGLLTWILAYVGLGSILRRFQETPPVAISGQPPPQPPAPA